jgi:hypothetical protein
MIKDGIVACISLENINFARKISKKQADRRENRQASVRPEL